MKRGNLEDADTRRIRLLIYDLDGTLIDSRRDIADSVNGTLQELGLRPLPPEEVSGFVGDGVKNLMQQSLQAAGQGPLPPLEKSIKLFRRRYGEHLLDATRLYPGVRKVLEFFRDRKQAVVTNKPADFTREILLGLEIHSHFFRVIGGDDGFPKKPDPEAVFELLKESGVRPSETLLVGDSAIDIETGRRAGVKTAAVTYGFGGIESLKAAGPDSLLTNLEELISCLRSRD